MLPRLRPHRHGSQRLRFSHRSGPSEEAGSLIPVPAPQFFSSHRQVLPSRVPSSPRRSPHREVQGCPPRPASPVCTACTRQRSAPGLPALSSICGTFSDLPLPTGYLIPALTLRNAEAYHPNGQTSIKPPHTPAVCQVPHTTRSFPVRS